MNDEIYGGRERSEMVYQEGRFNKPANPGEQFKSRYDMPTTELNDLQQRAIAPIISKRYENIGTVGIVEEEIKTPGRGVYLIFEVITTATGAKQNISIMAESPEAQLFISRKRPDLLVPCKHGQGFRGDFVTLFLQMSAMSATFNATYTLNLNVMILTFDGEPMQHNGL